MTTCSSKRRKLLVARLPAHPVRPTTKSLMCSDAVPHGRQAADERAAVGRFYENQTTRLAAGELDAAAIAGEKSTDDRLIERAAWTLVARAVLNLDEVITKE